MNDSKLIWAAGGESLCAPEDTLPAYWGALGAGADGLALGVQLTSDDVLVCCRNATLADTTGDKRRVGQVTAAELRALDAGAMFRSTELDGENQPAGRGDDIPWVGHAKKGDALYHPELVEVLLNFSTRTALLLHLITPRRERAARRQALVEATLAELARFGLTRDAVVAGDADVLRLVRKASPETPLALVLTGGEDEELKTRIKELKPAYLIVNAESVARRQKRGIELDAAFVKSLGKGKLRVIITSAAMPFALSPDYFRALDAEDWVAGYVCRAVRETKEMSRPSHLVVEDDFRGKSINRTLWTMGYSKMNRDTEIRHADGLFIKIRGGGEYSGASALTTYSIRGDFDAQVSFKVASPAQGTTFELAAIQVDPGYHNTDNTKINRDNANLTFDVHGAPPYASSERDEDDGFRIGWNNGPAVLRIVDTGHGTETQSVNAYNKYSRDVGDGAKDNPSGQLRLVRCGEVFNAYYTDKHNRQWVLSGSASVPTLCRDVYLRLGAKHWPKGGRVPPPNQIDFHSFRLSQH